MLLMYVVVERNLVHQKYTLSRYLLKNPYECLMDLPLPMMWLLIFIIPATYGKHLKYYCFLQRTPPQLIMTKLRVVMHVALVYNSLNTYLI